MSEWIGGKLKYDPFRVVPDVLVDKALDLKHQMAALNIVSIHGMGDVYGLQRQLAEVTRERDMYKNMTELHDALNDRRRAIADNERRTIRGR